MNTVDIKDVLIKQRTEEMNAEMLQEARIYLAEKQIYGLEKILLTGAETMASPSNWNYVCGLIDQLKAMIPSIWNPKLGLMACQEIDTGDEYE